MVSVMLERDCVGGVSFSTDKGKSSAYNAGGRRLWITDGTQDEFTGTCLFFLRFNVQKPVTMANIHLVSGCNICVAHEQF